MEGEGKVRTLRSVVESIIRDIEQVDPGVRERYREALRECPFTESMDQPLSEERYASAQLYLRMAALAMLARNRPDYSRN